MNEIILPALQAQMSALRGEVAALRGEIKFLRERLEADGRLGPSPWTDAEVAERATRLDALVEKVRAGNALPVPPVDRSAQCTTSGEPPEKVRAEQTEKTGQHKAYIVLCEEERQKGFVRPYRDAYRHKTCGTVTTMGRALSETYARDPTFYGGTFCVHCDKHLPVEEFTWTADGQQVGS